MIHSPTPFTSRFQSLVAAWCWIPLTAFTCVAGLFVAARIRLGAWPQGMRTEPGALFPTPSDLDPKNLGWAYSATLILLFASFLAPAVLIGAAGTSPNRIKFRELVALTGGLVSLGVLIFADPFGIWNWFLD